MGSNPIIRTRSFRVVLVANPLTGGRDVDSKGAGFCCCTSPMVEISKVVSFKQGTLDASPDNLSGHQPINK